MEMAGRSGWLGAIRDEGTTCCLGEREVEEAKGEVAALHRGASTDSNNMEHHLQRDSKAKTARAQCVMRDWG
jgi:hypothetical protein